MKKALAIGLPIVALLVALVLLLPYNTPISQTTEVLCYSPTDQFVDRSFSIEVEGKFVNNPVRKDRVKATVTIKQVGYNFTYQVDDAYVKTGLTFHDQPVCMIYGQSDTMDSCTIFFTEDLKFYLLHDSNKVGNTYVTTDDQETFLEFQNLCAEYTEGGLTPITTETEKA